MVDKPYPKPQNLEVGSTSGELASSMSGWSPVALPSQGPLPGSPSGFHLPGTKPYHWRWMLLGVGGCFATSGVAVGAFLWLINLPPQADCDNPAALSSDRTQLYCAQAAAASGEQADILKSLELIGQWNEGHPLHQEILPLAEDWSQTALDVAKKRLRDNDLEGAIALVQRIPSFSPNYEQAQALMVTWQQEWQQGESLYNQAQAAIQAKDWATARRMADALSQLGNEHWRTLQPKNLRRQIRQEQAAQKLLLQAKSQAVNGGVESLSAAIRVATQIDPETYTWKETVPFLDRWSDMLLQVGLQHWYALDLEQAIALGKTVSQNPHRTQAAQELIWLAKARKLARTSLGEWQPQPRQALQLYRAMLLVNRIRPDSQFYPQARSSLSTWQVHLQDLGRLQVAQTLGQFQHRESLRAAIAQAQQVPADNPRRVQAQTLVAHWQKEIQRIEDRPLLDQARKLATAGSIDSLLQAIQAASRISPDRPLRKEAQNWIYVWNYRIETLEDQPLLDKARDLAAAGSLAQAVVAASDIRPGRALYDEAQSAISSWKGRIRARELARQRALQEAQRRRQRELAEPAQPATDQESEPAPQPTNRPRPEPAAESGPQWSNQSRPEAPANNLPDRIETIPGPSSPTLPGSSSPETRPSSGGEDGASSTPSLITPAPIPTTPTQPAPAPVPVSPPKPTPASQDEKSVSQQSSEPLSVFAGALYAAG